MQNESPINTDKRLEALETKVDALVTKKEFRGLETKVENMVTREEFNTTMDEVLTIVRRLDQERVFTIEWVRRIEADVARVKQHLHLV